MTEKKLSKRIMKKLKKMECKAGFSFEKLLYPESHSYVKRFFKENPSCSTSPCPAHCKCKGDKMLGANANFEDRPLKKNVACAWRFKHWEYMQRKKLCPKKVARVAKKLRAACLATPRRKHVAAIKIVEVEQKAPC